MELKQQIQEDMKNAMRAKEPFRLGTIRMLLAAIKQKEIDERITVDDQGILTIIHKMIKQRRDSEAQYQAANRQELADKEQQEIEILQHYLPKQLNEAEITTAVTQIIKQLNVSSLQDLGKVMSAAKQELAGQADMAIVSRTVKDILSK